MKKIILSIVLCFIFGCSKKLDLKPDSSLVIPKTLRDFENLLDNTEIMNSTPALAQLSSDEYLIRSYEIWQSLFTPVTRTAYIWQADIFEGETQVYDWTVSYKQVFYSNSILDLLANQDAKKGADWDRIKGWALFARAYAFYNLVSTYSKAYDSTTAGNDLGIPLKLSSSVSELVPRSSVQQSYDQIIKDALESAELLQQDIIQNKKNRPSKVAAYALLARVYTSMREYREAEIYADKSLSLYSKLTDYNTLTILPTTSSFTYNSEETIYFTQQNNPSYSQVTYANGALYGIDTNLISLYNPSDLRKKVYFRINANGNYAMKGINNAIAYPFTGLATDEMYLIKAECLSRRGQTDQATDLLNQLLITRWNPNATIPAKNYQNLVANNATKALEIILTERRKELIWRSLRWTDLKRLNLEGHNITLTRNLSGRIYTLTPNSPKYVMPIPDDEVSLSGIQQNIR